METIETRTDGAGMMSQRKSGRYHNVGKRDSTTSLNPIIEPKKLVKSLSYSDLLPNNDEYIEIVLRGNDTRDDDDTRWVSSSSSSDEEAGESSQADTQVEGYILDEDELLEPPSWDEEEEEEEEDEEYLDFGEIDYVDTLDYHHQSLLETSSAASGVDDYLHNDATDNNKRIGMSIQRYNELLEEDSLRLRRMYQWLEQTVNEERREISVENAKSLMDNYDLQVQVQVLQEDKQILSEKLQQMEAKVVQLTMESIFHANRIQALEDEHKKNTILRN